MRLEWGVLVKDGVKDLKCGNCKCGWSEAKWWVLDLRKEY